MSSAGGHDDRPGPAGRQPSSEATEGFLRPEATVLPESSLVPAGNLISPPPNRFSHELVAATPYYYEQGAASTQPPAGELPAGTKVLLLVYGGGEFCGVVDGQGLYVQLAYSKLKRL